jgi:hypothetical protein
MKLKLSSEGVMASVGKALGLGDLQIGDPVFDERFLVRTGDAERARAWLAAEEVRAALLASIPGYAFALEKGQLKAQRAMVETDPVVLTGIIRAVAALAGGGMTLHAAWAEIAKELGGTLGGEALLPGESRFEAEVHGRQLSVAITADGVTLERELGMRDAPAFSLEGAEPLASIPEAARLFGGPSSESDWQAVQPAKLTGAGAVVTLSWNGYRPERTRLVAAARLLAAVESGPYR